MKALLTPAIGVGLFWVSPASAQEPPPVSPPNDSALPAKPEAPAEAEVTETPLVDPTNVPESSASRPPVPANPPDVPPMEAEDLPEDTEPDPAAPADPNETPSPASHGIWANAFERVLDPNSAALGPAATAIRPTRALFSPYVGGRPSRLTWGPWSLNASLGFGVFGEKNGRGSQPNGGEGWETALRITPTLSGTLGYPASGKFVEFDYANSIDMSGREGGATDQVLALRGHYGFAKLQLVGGLDYSHSTGVDRDFGSAVDRDLIGASLNAYYPVSMKSSLQGTLTAQRNAYGEGISSDEFTGSLFFDRQATAKMHTGLGVTLGATELDQGESQTFQQVHLRAGYRPTAKLNFSASVGYELRQIGGATSGAPIFDGSVSYAVRPTTTLGLSFSRAVFNSARATQTNYTSTTIAATASQRLGSQMNASLTVGYQQSEYESYNGASSSTAGATGSAEGGRSDKFFFIRPSLTYRVTERLSFSLYYSYNNNRSNTGTFVDQQVGLNGMIHF